ncbi:MAG TPA: hypothetical protein VE549_01375 [Myxococcaceae bacterium]|nr:hypothetical protein [Myxococcaceae bacterium]
MRPFVAALLAAFSLPALADQRFVEAEASTPALPWLWILLASGALLGVFLVWAWGRRIPPPAQPWR